MQITRKENPADTFQFDASFQRYVAMDFIELFSAHATYKFLIYDRSDESIHGLVNNHPNGKPVLAKYLELKHTLNRYGSSTPISRYTTQSQTLMVDGRGVRD